MAGVASCGSENSNVSGACFIQRVNHCSAGCFVIDGGAANPVRGLFEVCLQFFIENRGAPLCHVNFVLRAQVDQGSAGNRRHNDVAACLNQRFCLADDVFSSLILTVDDLHADVGSDIVEIALISGTQTIGIAPADKADLHGFAFGRLDVGGCICGGCRGICCGGICCGGIRAGGFGGLAAAADEDGHHHDGGEQ